MASASLSFIHNFYTIGPVTLALSSFAKIWDVPTNPLYRLKAGLHAKGRKIIDLASGSVSTQGIHFPPNILRRAFVGAIPKTKIYKPDPLGQPEARQAVSRFYAGEGLQIPPGQIVMTPGTSISYWYAFKVLADPGGEILAPSPSYPLFESIAQLSGVTLVPYRLKEASRWDIDFEGMESAISARTCAIILISPHNPTGAVATEEEVRHLAAIAARKNLAIIADEVFSPFLFERTRLPRPANQKAPLVLTLNGFSKMLALPGLKIGWMAVTGDPKLVAKTIKALDMLSDTFLPVNEIAQAAVPALLRDSEAFQRSYPSEIRRRMNVATTLLSGTPAFSFIRPEGGFYLTLALRKNGMEEEAMACRLLEKKRILVHPGYFYDMEGRHLVLSFASRPEVLREALRTVIGESR
jgi:aspartate/methionine/tyrosine aminotransferase